MNGKAIADLSPLAEGVKAQNPDRYLATLFAPPASRDALFALYAFDHELAHIQAIVREPMAGLIRLQWWQDVIDGFGKGTAVAHPVIRHLERAVVDKGLDPALLMRAIEGRRRPFEDDRPAGLPDFERYLRDIGGSVACAAAGLLGVREGQALAVADRVGLVFAAWQRYRLLAPSAPDQKAWLPAVWCEGQGAEPDRGLQKAARKRLADWALAELAKARGHRISLPREALPAFFPGTLAGLRLRDLDGSSVEPTLSLAVPRLIWCWLRRRF